MLKLIKILFEPIVNRLKTGIQKLYFLVWKNKRIRTLKKQVQEYADKKQQDECCLLGIPSMENKTNIGTTVLSGKFIFTIPPEYARRMEPYHFSSHLNQRENRSLKEKLKDFIQVNFGLEKNEVEEFIAKAIEETARDFLEALERGEQKSNNDMYGIHKITRYPADYDIELFLTDYFTYNCVVSLYKRLRKHQPHDNPLVVKTLEDIERISPFVSGCGCGGFLSLKLHSAESFLVTHRSATVACPLHWHSSFDETFDPRDKSSVQGAPPSVEICIKRGIREELGICLEAEKYYINSLILLMIQNEERCELGIMSYITCRLKRRKDIDRIINNLFSASDADNENQKIYLIPENEVTRFFLQKKHQGELLTMESFRMWKIFKRIKESYKPADYFWDTLLIDDNTTN